MRAFLAARASDSCDDPADDGVQSHERQHEPCDPQITSQDPLVTSTRNGLGTGAVSGDW